MQIRSADRSDRLTDRSFSLQRSMDITNSLAPTVPFMQKRFFAAIPDTRQSLESKILPVIRGKIRSVVEATEMGGKTQRSNFLLPLKASNKSERTIERVDQEEEVELKPKPAEKEPDINAANLKFLKYKFQTYKTPVANADEQYGQYRKYAPRRALEDLVKEQFVYAPHPKHPKTYQALFLEKHN